MDLGRLRRGSMGPPCPLADPEYYDGAWQPPVMTAPDTMELADVVERMHIYAAREYRQIDARHRGRWLRVHPWAPKFWDPFGNARSYEVIGADLKASEGGQ